MSARHMMMARYDALPYEYRRIIDETNEFFTVIECYEKKKTAVETRNIVNQILKKYESEQRAQLAYELFRARNKQKLIQR